MTGDALEESKFYESYSMASPQLNDVPSAWMTENPMHTLACIISTVALFCNNIITTVRKYVPMLKDKSRCRNDFSSSHLQFFFFFWNTRCKLSLISDGMHSYSDLRFRGHRCLLVTLLPSYPPRMLINQSWGAERQTFGSLSTKP